MNPQGPISKRTISGLLTLFLTATVCISQSDSPTETSVIVEKAASDYISALSGKETNLFWFLGRGVGSDLLEAGANKVKVDEVKGKWREKIAADRTKEIVFEPFDNEAYDKDRQAWMAKHPWGLDPHDPCWIIFQPGAQVQSLRAGDWAGGLNEYNEERWWVYVDLEYTSKERSPKLVNVKTGQRGNLRKGRATLWITKGLKTTNGLIKVWDMCWFNSPELW
jgi:hypothetical protein